MKFEIKGKTKLANDSLIVASGDKKYRKIAKLVQSDPAILVIEHKTLGKWLKKFTKRLGVDESAFFNNPTWVNSIKEKTLKNLEKNTEVPKEEFEVNIYE